MSAIRVNTRHFSAAARVFEVTPTGLAACVRGLAIDHARIKIENANVVDFTDNTGGSAVGTLPALRTVFTSFNATAAGGSQTTALNTTLGKIRNAQRVMANTLNNARGRLGLSVVTPLEGTQATANTLPAQDLTSTAASGATAATAISAGAALNVARANQVKLARAANEIMTAIGSPAIKSLITGIVSSDYILALIPAATSSVDGTLAASAAEVDVFLTALANNYASIAKQYNTAINQGAVTALTDSTGGTSGGDSLAVITATPLVGYTDVATSSAPAAALNTLLALYRNAQASLAATVNQLLSENNLAPLTDLTAGTVSSTLAAEAASLTAVAGALSVTQTSAVAALLAFTNNVATLTAAVNLATKEFALLPIADASGGTASLTSTLVAIPAVVAGDNTSAAIGVLNTALSTVLASARNSMATLAAKVNAMTGSAAAQGGLRVVAV